jgi:hypothetical protein
MGEQEQKLSKRGKAAVFAFQDSYADGRFSFFKSWVTDSDENLGDTDFEDWVSDLDLDTPQSALLVRMLMDFDLSVSFFWEDEDEPWESHICIFWKGNGTVATADLQTMVRDAIRGVDSSSLGAIRKFRDMVIAETKELEMRIENKEVP